MLDEIEGISFTYYQLSSYSTILCLLINLIQTTDQSKEIKGEVKSGELTFSKKSKINRNRVKDCKVASYTGNYILFDGIEYFHGKGKAVYKNQYVIIFSLLL